MIAAPSIFPQLPNILANILFWGGMLGIIITIILPIKDKVELGDTSLNIFQKMSGLLSFNNTQQVNIGSQERKFENTLKNNLQDTFKSIPNTYKKFRIYANHNDSECFNFAMRVKEFFIQNGYEYDSFISTNSITGGNGNPQLELDGKEYIDIIIGANIKTDKLLSMSGGMMMGMGKL